MDMYEPCLEIMHAVLWGTRVPRIPTAFRRDDGWDRRRGLVLALLGLEHANIYGHVGKVNACG